MLVWLGSFSLGSANDICEAVRYPFINYKSSPRRFADDTITVKCLDFLNLIKCSNYSIVHTAKNEGIHLYGEGALVLINFV